LYDFDYPKVKHSLGQAALQDPYPAWFLDSRGVIYAANLMAFWLWDMINPGEPIRPGALLGKSAFTILAGNLKRIPVEENSEFYAKRSAAVKRLSDKLGTDSLLYAPFITAMKNDPLLAQIYEQAVLYPDREWDYTLSIAPPRIMGNNNSKLLIFQVTVFRLEGDAGFLATYTPTRATLPVVEELYSLLTDQYNDRVFIQPGDNPQGDVESNQLPGPSESLYHEYYPSLIHDPLWYITGENKAQRLLVGASMKGRHFFELFFAPQLREWLGPLQETSAPRALRYFDMFTAGFLREDHELHAGYEQVMKHLLHLDAFRNVLEVSRKLSIRIFIPENRHEPFYTCRVILPWPLSYEIALQFRCMVRLLHKNLLVYTDMWDYQVTLLPENYQTEVALILMLLASTAPARDEATAFSQLLWLLAMMKTIEERLSMEDRADAGWEPEAAFGRIRNQLDTKFSKHTEDETGMVVAELREVIETLDSRGMIEKKVLLGMLGHLTAANTYLAQLSAFIIEELEGCRSIDVPGL